ncbi:hypothetical protein D7X55_22765 [Corallococcus sp. AB049A]|uniref:Uncharacterized protein n=1 Tax=Corallococcus interemptor TaxID=2316720 RepID=A0A3A8Q1Q3_9BACT|nr:MULTISPECIES: hypothetical protein [Corallococcus]RKH40783.1 hypothetical protein D7Y23_34140 [Corallococcus sp. AB050B]RKH58772.1 hypothetical protein D7X96_36390 [Corallococcus interemptor]RKI61832.1 hypothetical protein D7X55_22765 [Corallococcus sp. AB049A]
MGLGPIILFLLFMGAEKVVNRIAKRPLMNGAAWYLGAAAVLFVWTWMRGNSLIAERAGEGAMGMQAEFLGRVIGHFLLPVGAAIHYARKFERTPQSHDIEEATGDAPDA